MDDDAFWASAEVLQAVDRASAQLARSTAAPAAGPAANARGYQQPQPPQQTSYRPQQPPQQPQWHQQRTGPAAAFTSGPGQGSGTSGGPRQAPAAAPFNQNVNPNSSAGFARPASAPKPGEVAPGGRPGSAPSKAPNAPTITFKLELTSDVRLAVSVDVNPIPAIISTIKSLPNPPPAIKNGQRLTWTFPITAYSAVVDGLSKSPSLVAKLDGALPPWLVRALCELRPQEQLLEDDPLEQRVLPPALKDKLFEYQKEGIRFILRKKGRALIGDEMGLGKTVQALGAALFYRREWPLLIITPSSLKYSWCEAFESWGTGVSATRVLVCDGKPERVDLRDVEVVIMTYDQATGSAAWLAQRNFQVVILDEAHYIKNYQAKRTQALVPILQRARRALLLTGTPLVSRPRELYPLLTALHGNLFPGPSFQADFGARYCDPKQVRQWRGGGSGFTVTTYDGASRVEELHVLLRTVMVRRMKRDVLAQLPAKRRQRVLVQAEEGLLGQLRKDIAASRKALDEAKRGDRAPPASMPQMIELYRLTGLAKVKAVEEYVADALESFGEAGEKFLVFSHHLQVGDAIEGVLKKAKMAAGKEYIRITGQTAPHERQSLVAAFQNDPRCRVAVLSITAAGTGLTLTAASTAIFAELAWTPADIFQAEDRIHRIGQESHKVEIRYLVAQGTADDIMWHMLDKKIGVTTQAMNGHGASLEASTEGGHTASSSSAAAAAAAAAASALAPDIRSHFGPAAPALAASHPPARPAPPGPPSSSSSSSSASSSGKASGARRGARAPASTSGPAGAALPPEVVDLCADLPPGLFDDDGAPGGGAGGGGHPDGAAGYAEVGGSGYFGFDGAEEGYNAYQVEGVLHAGGGWVGGPADPAPGPPAKRARW
eukprot:tig00021168_g19126.t1